MEALPKKALCLYCKSEQEYDLYEVKKLRSSQQIGVLFEYQRLFARCRVCGNNIYIPELEKENDDRVEKEKNKKVANTEWK